MKIKKGVSIDPTIYEKAKKIAEYKGLSFSQYVEICLRNAVEYQSRNFSINDKSELKEILMKNYMNKNFGTLSYDKLAENTSYNIGDDYKERRN